MIRVMFVCHGNICRSPMAEFLLKDLVKKKGLEDKFIIKSSGVSSEELGNAVHRGTRAVLEKRGISCFGKYAETLSPSDYDKYDYFIGMDERNRYNMVRLFDGDKDNKVSLLMNYTDTPGDVADPWWTGNFEETYRDVSKGIKALYEFLKK